MSNLRGVAMALLGFAIFAAHDAIIKHLGQTYAVTAIIFMAVLFALAPTSIMILADRAKENFIPRRPLLVVLRSMLHTGAVLCAFYAFTRLPLAEAYALLFAMPLFVTALSVPLLGEVVRFRRWAAVIVGLCGVLVVLRPGVTEITLGHLAALAAALCAALATIIMRKIGGGERFAVLLLYPMLLSLLVMGATLPASYKPIALEDLALMAVVGLLSMLGQICVITAVRSTPAALVAPTQYSQIIWATLFGALFFDESPDLYVAIGSAVVILSGVFIIWRESRENVSTTNPVLNTSNPRFDTGEALRTEPPKAGV